MYQRILVPVDGSLTAGRGLDEAIRLATLTHGRLLLVHRVDDLYAIAGFEAIAAQAGEIVRLLREAGEQVLREGKARAEQAGLQVETCQIEGVAVRLADLIVEQATAWHADLVVIGSHGRRGAKRFFLGSDAEQIVRTAPVPVLVVRAPEPGYSGAAR
jgi:nucleotide-binding universal stress UspA family protein